MLQHFRFLIRQIAYDLRVGILLRPALIIGGLAAFGGALSYVESPGGPLSAASLPVFHGEPASAQLILATIASAMMTVISIVYSVLLMALSLASIQFSPRILARFVSDDISQTTLGLFVGTFLYCLIVLPQVRAEPAYVPALSVSAALVLALFDLAYLIYFIHHISRNIQANHILDTLASQTEAVIDEVFPRPYVAAAGEEAPDSKRPLEDAVRLPSPTSGYVQIIDADALREIADANDLVVEARRGVGDYVPAGGLLVKISPTERVDEAIRAACVEAFDIGPTRTMQDDVEFGVRQIVDIGLKAISPAVNDPSTANTCIDQLSRLLTRLAGRDTRPRSGNVRLRQATFISVLDLAFNQLRQYGRQDLAVSIRLLGALRDIAEVATDPAHLRRVSHHATLVAAGCGDHHASERVVLAERLAEVQSLAAEV